jgi:general stress protein 26
VVNTSTSASNEAERFHELIHGIRFAMMATTDAAGMSRARPMTTQDPEAGSDLRFLTSDQTNLAEELEANSNVLLTYADSEHHRYVSVNGTATLRHDPAMVKQLWNPAYQAWFPKGPDDPTITIIMVEPSRVEYWDAPAAPVRLIQFVKAIATGKQAPGGEHRTLAL